MAKGAERWRRGASPWRRRPTGCSVCCRRGITGGCVGILDRIPLTYRQSLYRARQPLGFVYFIETGVGSLVNTMANGQAAEVGTIGNEGMVGLPLLLGDDRAPTSVYVQVPGAGLRMTAAQFSPSWRAAPRCGR